MRSFRWALTIGLLLLAATAQAQLLTTHAGGVAGGGVVNACPGGTTGQLDFSSACNGAYYPLLLGKP